MGVPVYPIYPVYSIYLAEHPEGYIPLLLGVRPPFGVCVCAAVSEMKYFEISFSWPIISLLQTETRKLANSTNINPLSQRHNSGNSH